MKIILKSTPWRGLLLGATILVSCASALRAQPSPVGSWDFVLTGNQRGVAQITFLEDFTLNGIEIITVRPIGTGETSNDDERGGSGDDRTPGTGGGGASEAITNFYGIAVLTGIWTFDSSGRVIGVLTESGASTNSTTNGISFRAVTRPEVRVTMTGLRNGRRINYRGVPYQTLATDFSGNYYGTGKIAGRPFNEIFTLAPSSDPILAPLSLGNLYDVSGLGPAYPFSGLALVSRQNVFGLASMSFQNTNGALRSIIGPFNLSRAAGALTGVTVNGDEESNVRMSIRRQ